MSPVISPATLPPQHADAKATDCAAPASGADPASGQAKTWAAGHRAALAAALSMALTTALCVWLACSYQDDFHVYLEGAHGLFSGALYSHSTRGDLFTYPPFAALLFVPLECLSSTTAAQVLWALLNEAALLGLLTVSIRAVRPDLPRRSRRLWALGLSAPALLSDPVLLAVRHGQVDILITLLVVWDLIGARRPGTRTVPAGVATGLAAAIKLTPLIFVPYLLLTRRFKAAWRCIGTFVAAEAIAFAVSPSASKAYWTHDLFDYRRVGGALGLQGLFAPTNQSLLGALGRLNHGAVPSGVLWTVAGVLAVLGVALAAYVHFRWSAFLGVALCATTGLLISPVTWTHHMIWVIPVVVWLGASPARPRWGRPAAAFTTVLFWITPIWWVADEGQAPLHENGWQLMAGNAFFLWMVLLLVACAASVYRYRGTRLVSRMAARRDGRLGWSARQHPELVEPAPGSAYDEAAAWPLDDDASNSVRPLVH
jgi:alpha-1,2-mannosyltransferase